MSKNEFETAVERLKALPEKAKADIARQLNQYLNKLEKMRRAIRVGLESGDAKSADHVLDRLEQKYRRMMDISDAL